MTQTKKNALGRGLASLLGPQGEGGPGGLSVVSLGVDRITPGTLQPRKYFADTELKELASSIREKGVLQPILVRLTSPEGNYDLIAGERRWRATKIAGLQEIPAIICEFSDKEALEVALLENIQREDLNPIEEAQAYRRLAEEFSHTQETLSRILGKSRSTIANTLRLLTLPQSVQDHLISGKLSPGHGRSLVGTSNPEEIADLIIAKKLNVRQAEALTKKKEAPSSSPSDPEQEILKTQLCEILNWPVDLIFKGVGGTISLSFKDPAELDQLINKFNKIKPPTGDSVRRAWSG